MSLDQIRKFLKESKKVDLEFYVLRVAQGGSVGRPAPAVGGGRSGSGCAIFIASAIKRTWPCGRDPWKES